MSQVRYVLDQSNFKQTHRKEKNSIKKSYILPILLNHRYNKSNKKRNKKKGMKFSQHQMEMRNLRNQKEESQDYAMNVSYTIHSLIFIEHNVKQNLILEEHRINFYLCTYNLLKAVTLYDMTGVNDITSSDHLLLYKQSYFRFISLRSKLQNLKSVYRLYATTYV